MRNLNVRRAAIGLVLIGGLTLVGCSDRTESSRLAPGTRAVLVSEEDTGMVFVDDLPNREFPQTPTGTKVRVLADKEQGADSPGRKVQVKFEDGPYEGQVGAVLRKRLHVAPGPKTTSKATSDSAGSEPRLVNLKDPS